MDIRQLRYFQSVVGSGSITAAAHLAGVSQPAITHRLKQLEVELGIQLFVRNARGVSLTDAGEVFSGHVDRLLGDFESIGDAVGAFRKPVAQPVVIGMAPTPVRALAADLLSLSMGNFTISIREGLSDELVKWVELRQIDCAICYDPVPSNRNVRIETLCFENPVAVSRHGLFEPSADATIPFADLSGFTVVLDGAYQGARRLIDRLAVETGAGLNIVTAASVTVKRELIARGRCCTIVPYGLYRDELESGLLESRRIVEPEIQRALSLVMLASSGRRLAPLARRIAKLVDAKVAAGGMRWRMSPDAVASA